MNFEQMIAAMTPDIYQSLKSSVETGKWPNGAALTKEQKETSLRAVIAYEHQHNIPEEKRTGFIDRRRADGSVKGQDPFAAENIKILTGE